MDKLQKAIQEELANRLRNGKIKTSKDLSDLFHEIYRLGIQEMLKAEMDEHLGYEKHAPEGVEHTNTDLRLIYNAPDAELGLIELKHFDEKWGHKYPYIVKSWNANWEHLSTFFEFPDGIQKIIHTTNLMKISTVVSESIQKRDPFYQTTRQSKK